jgi:Flp pilus assembly protein TadD
MLSPLTLQGLGRHQDALAAYDATLVLDPTYYEASCNRGNILHELGQLEDALAAWADTLKIRPGFLPALTNRANILLQLGRAEEAILSCNEVMRRAPEHSQCLGIRGAALHKLGRLGEALASLDEAVGLNPAAPDKWLNRGNVLKDLDRHPEAVASYNEALRIKPHYPEALSGLGVALKEAGQIDEALVYFDEALKHKPGYPDARNNRAGALLLMGSLKAGFEDFESRWDRSNAPPKTLVSDLPIWEGQKLTGQAIVVWEEQGLGDLIQFSRYLLCLVEAGAEVTLLCRKNMHRLLRTLPKPVRLVETLDSNESFAFQCALMSLPCGFQTSLETVPNPLPSSRTGPRREMGRADRHRRFPNRRWLARQQIDRPSKVDSACLFRAARGNGRRAADQPHEGSSGHRGGNAGRWAVHDRELGKRFRCRTRFLRGLRGGDGEPRPRRYLGYRNRASCRGLGKAGFSRPETRAGLALADAPRGLPLVSQHATLSPSRKRRLGVRF